MIEARVGDFSRWLERLLRAVLVTSLLGATLGASQDAAVTSDPSKTVIVTSDIPNFWRAFDDATRAPSLVQQADVFKREYLVPGSDGLWAFMNNRIQSPRHLAEVVAANRAAYESVRAASLTVPSAVSAIVADFKRFKAFYPDAVFPNIYFVVGALNSGGTSVAGVGDVIGVEVTLATGSRAIAPIVAHETIHYNQHDANQTTLLDSTIHEGTADFLGDLADGATTSADVWSFGCAHEAELWKLFQTQAAATNGDTIGAWLFSKKTPLDAPPFIGYWIGYRIVQTYYEHARDKKSAIAQILRIQDFKQFLSSSGYPEEKPACTRVARWP